MIYNATPNVLRSFYISLIPTNSLFWFRLFCTLSTFGNYADKIINYITIPVYLQNFTEYFYIF
ncbi:hypothetical protein BX070DRAFT_222079 [Coemansia spiralis]|nr:hypothetical protein BX070DRAFT_222079 [Coemansia spiralis]